MEEGGEGKCVKNISPERWRRLSHKERRTYVNKQRRRYRRRCLARKRETARTVLESQPEYMEGVCEEEKRLAEELRRDEARSMLENAAWMQRERVAQEEFSKKRELEERRRSEREERERLIHEEWEALKKKEKEETEAKEKEKMEKEERLKEALSVGDKPPVTGKESWHNPIAPEGYETSHTPHRDMEVEQNHCSFFLKTGACRFGDRCSRQHPRPTSSCTLLIPAMYSCLGLQEQMLNEKNQDAALEHDEEETYEDFRKFYDDVLPEFLKAGKVVQFKVSCNHEAHLRGNVYVQYTREEECAGAFQMFNGRWYAQKQLSCTFCPVTKWKSAICGLFNQKRCPKGKHCNFLHVFRNPTGAFSRADRDLPPLSRSPHLPHHSSRHHSSPLFHRRQHQWDRNRSFSYSSRQRSRSRSRSESRERSRRRHQRPRSRSRERYHRSHWRSESSERSKYNKRSPQKSESRERRSRSRSESRDRNYRRSHSRSESRERSRRNHHRSRSRSKSRERCPRLRSESKSPDGRSSLSKSPSSCNGRNHQRSHRKKRRKGKKHSSLTSKHIKHRHKSKKKHSCHHHHTLEAGPPQDECRPSEVQDKPTKVQDNLTELQDDPTELQDDPTELQDDPTELQDDPTELQDDPTELQDKDRV